MKNRTFSTIWVLAALLVEDVDCFKTMVSGLCKCVQIIQTQKST